MRGETDKTASMADVFTAPAILLIGNDPTEQHPLLAWQIRNNVRLHRAKLYVVNHESIKLRRQATVFAQVTGEADFVSFLGKNDPASAALGVNGTTADTLATLRETLRNEPNVVVIFGSEIQDANIQQLVSALPNAKFICLGDYANSRGAADMGLYPDLLPGYHAAQSRTSIHEEWNVPQTPGMHTAEMVVAAQTGKLKALYVVGSNPIGRSQIDPFGGGVRADMGQSRGAQSGEVDRHAVWLEDQGLEPKLSPLDPIAILDEIQRLVPGYDVSRVNLLGGNTEHTSLNNSGAGVTGAPALISPANDSLFTSGTLGRYSRVLKSVVESHEVKPAEVAAD
jgi:hypothetical protein